MKKNHITALVTLAVLAACSARKDGAPTPPATASTTATAAATPSIGQVEIVAELDITPGNVTASKEGRVFASIHGMRRGPVQLVEVTGKNTYVPFPDAGWNARPGSGPDVLNTPHGVLIDGKERLWVVDHGNWMDKPQPPKLLAFDIATRRLAYRHDFDRVTAPSGQILQDLAVDDARGFAYVADCGPDPALVVVDLNQNTARRFAGHPSLAAEDIELVVEGKPLLFPGADGKMGPARVGVNPVTLSANGETLYFGSMNGSSWFALPAKLLRDGASDADIGAAILRVGPKPLSDAPPPTPRATTTLPTWPRTASTCWPRAANCVRWCAMRACCGPTTPTSVPIRGCMSRSTSCTAIRSFPAPWARASRPT